MSSELVLRRYTATAVEETRSPSITEALEALGQRNGVRSSELSLADASTAGIHIVGGPHRFGCWVQRWGEATLNRPAR